MDAIEVTTFKLTSGLTIDDFVAANADVDAWLLRQPGLISRRIPQRSDGMVVDLLIWASVRDGETAAARLMDELAASPVHSAIDQSKVSWTVSTVPHFLLLWPREDSQTKLPTGQRDLPPFARLQKPDALRPGHGFPT